MLSLIGFLITLDAFSIGQVAAVYRQMKIVMLVYVVLHGLVLTACLLTLQLVPALVSILITVPLAYHVKLLFDQESANQSQTYAVQKQTSCYVLPY